MVNANPIPPLTARQIEKFWKRVDASGDCWVWTGNRIRSGYGMFSMGAATGNKLAHRVVWHILVAPVPTDLEVDHLCFNKLCVNPDHLEPVTRIENNLRRRVHRRQVLTHCPKGHEYTKANTLLRSNGWRYCKKCDQRRIEIKRRKVKAPRPRRPKARTKDVQVWNGWKTHCPQGHPYDDENTRRYPSGKGGRQCKKCGAARAAAWVSDKPCSDPECDRPLVARGMCLMHYKRARKAENV